MAPKKRQTTAVKSKSSAKVAKSSNSSTDSRRENQELLKSAYGVTFPEDLFSLWDFCCRTSKDNPLDALSPSGLRMVGPFEVLARKIQVETSDSVNLHLHWRFYFDPPEFMTVLISDDTKDNHFHIGFIRDGPSDEECIVASNNGEDCVMNVMGDNLFCAICGDLAQKLSSAKGKRKSDLQTFLTKLKDHAKSSGINVEGHDNVNKRKKRVVNKTFHGAGIVVPIDENEVGYRPVGETDSKLKKMFKDIAEAVDDDRRMKAFDPLQELVTYVQLANDECDFGMGLELGMNMFCYGSRYLNKAAGRMLSMAYELLGRDLYKKVIEHHLADRRKENYARIP